MPNWCANNFGLKGPKEKIQELWTKIQEQNELLEVLVPLGEWNYMSSVEGWGTKWDVEIDGLEIEEEGDNATIFGWFDSAWSPPTDAYETFIQNNPDCYIEATFYEEGMQFIGRWENDEETVFEDIQELLMDGFENPIFLDLVEEYEVQLYEEEPEYEDAD